MTLVARSLSFADARLYTNAESTVLVDGSLDRWFQMAVGSRQGDPISPTTFLAYLECITDGVDETAGVKGVTICSQSTNNLK